MVKKTGLAVLGLILALAAVLSRAKEGTMGDGELRARLTAEQYRVTRQNGTEPPFENAYWNNHEPGLYVDVASGEPLFSSTDKFDSGTGWPSFTRPVEAGALVERRDSSLWMTRVEVRSRKADSHLGHVFEDGPKPTGLRYCINSAALRFVPAARLEAEGYGKFLPLFGKAPPAARTRKAVFAAGCFWGVEAAFRKLDGVVSARVGYTGGDVGHPSYEQVCSGTTGHAEAVEVEFDPARVSYARLLEAFWKMHNPAQRDGQGPDIGSQYRSAIFYHDAGQMKEAMAAKQSLEDSGRYKNGVATAVEPAREFWPAEEYHQNYYGKNGGKICRIF